MTRRSGTYIVLLAAVAGPTQAADPGTDFFEAKVRPVLVEHCYPCHSAQAKKHQGGLQLDTRDALRQGGDGGPVLVPGKPAESRLLRAIRYTDPDLKMPPKGKLPDAIIADLEKWITMGAPDPRTAAAAGKPINLEEARKFWSFQPLSQPAVPEIRDQQSAIHNPIDAFIVAKLGEKGLHQNPTADRRTLIRRAYFDLIGLPPTPEEVRAFVADSDPDAYAKLIDRLLASPHYGERWGRHWLDVARFGESSGYEHDNDRPHSYQYRDCVIEALNRDVPFDQFVRWQVAGDELDPLNPLAVKATGFLAVGVMNGQVTEREAEAARYEVFDDWVGTVGTAFLGLTVGCARCHDHKYDPIPTADYYRLAANFTAAVRANVNVPHDSAEARRTAADFEKQRQQAIEEFGNYKVEKPKVAAWLAAKPKLPAVWVGLERTDGRTDQSRHVLGPGYELTNEPGSSDWRLSRVNGEVSAISFTIETPLTDLRAVRIEALADDTLPNHGPGLGDYGNFTLNGVSLTTSPKNGQGKSQTVKLTLARSTTGAKGGAWSVGRAQAGRDQAAIYTFDKPAGFPGGTVLRFKFTCPGDSPAARQTIGKFRLSLCSAEVPVEIDAAEMAPDNYMDGVRDLADGRLSEFTELLYSHTDAEWLKRQSAGRRLWQSRPKPPYDTAFIVTEGVPPYRMMIQGPDLYDKTYILKRGDVNQKEAVAAPGVLQVLAPHGGKSPPPAAHPRSTLARWLTDVDQGAGALAARVIVNRLWQHHLGRGLVATPNDFGAQGDRPTHPELLDWLASELVARGWSLKAIHREIMLSATYQQSADHNPQAAAADPANRLWWRRPLVRLEAEPIRDAMLAVSGCLDRRLFGPGTLDESMTRRSIYFTVKRSELVPSLVQLDFPESLTSIGQRATTTVAPQALLMLNSPQVRANAKAFAESLRPLAERSLDDAVTAGYERAIGRSPTEAERTAAVAFLRRSADDGLPEALADFCQTLFALNEFFYVR